MILAIIMSLHFSAEQKIRSVSGAKNTYSNPEKAKIKTNILRLYCMKLKYVNEIYIEEFMYIIWWVWLWNIYTNLTNVSCMCHNHVKHTVAK